MILHGAVLELAMTSKMRTACCGASSPQAACACIAGPPPSRRLRMRMQQHGAPRSTPHNGAKSTRGCAVTPMAIVQGVALTAACDSRSPILAASPPRPATRLVEQAAGWPVALVCAPASCVALQAANAHWTDSAGAPQPAVPVVRKRTCLLGCLSLSTAEILLGLGMINERLSSWTSFAKCVSGLCLTLVRSAGLGVHFSAVVLILQPWQLGA
jgi:hypothetical protein